MSASVVCSRLSFAWPDGEAVFDDLETRFGVGRTGLVGVNGSGKSTLLRLIAGSLTPTAGSVNVEGECAYLPQNLVLAADARVDEVLGIADVRTSLAAIENGVAADHDFTVVGDRWDIEELTTATLSALGLAHIGLDRRVGTLSGGETILLGLSAALLAEPDVLLLDEPTNNLDLRARELVWDAVAAWKGAMVVVSHDRELLERMDRIGDLRGGEISFYGGGFSAYEEAVEAEQEAARRGVRAAESDLKRQRRELAEARIKLDRRQRYGQKMWDTKREPKVRMRKRIEDAEIAAGKHRNMHTGKVDQVADRLTEAEEAIRADDEIRIDLPDTAVPRGRRVFQLSDVELRTGARVSVEVRGPERIALVGPNGGGKTTLVDTLLGTVPAVSGAVHVDVPVGYLPQRLDLLDDSLSALSNVSAVAPTADTNTVRAGLARFLLRGDRAEQPVGTLSGGERFRATLAALLLADPAPRLLILDEPTNNLDLASFARLEGALRAYQGAFLVVSHDLPFLRAIGVTRWLRLEDNTLTG